MSHLWTDSLPILFPAQQLYGRFQYFLHSTLRQYRPSQDRHDRYAWGSAYAAYQSNAALHHERLAWWFWHYLPSIYAQQTQTSRQMTHRNEWLLGHWPPWCTGTFAFSVISNQPWLARHWCCAYLGRTGYRAVSCDTAHHSTERYQRHGLRCARFA